MKETRADCLKRSCSTHSERRITHATRIRTWWIGMILSAAEFSQCQTKERSKWGCSYWYNEALQFSLSDKTLAEISSSHSTHAREQARIGSNWTNAPKLCVSQWKTQNKSSAKGLGLSQQTVSKKLSIWSYLTTPVWLTKDVLASGCLGVGFVGAKSGCDLTCVLQAPTGLAPG